MVGEQQRLFKTKKIIMKNLNKINNNIYITSYKSPAINGYYLLNDNIICKKDETYFATIWKEREIILTTDQELIADGVQAIDDEFLEWFVKNASCEEVKVDKAEHGIYKDDVYYKLSNKIFYKIIIPKEEVLLQSSIDGEVIWGDKPEVRQL